MLNHPKKLKHFYDMKHVISPLWLHLWSRAIQIDFDWAFNWVELKHYNLKKAQKVCGSTVCTVTLVLGCELLYAVYVMLTEYHSFTCQGAYWEPVRPSCNVNMPHRNNSCYVLQLLEMFYLDMDFVTEWFHDTIFLI